VKEIFREPDFTRVAFFRTLLEDAGIPAMIRNEHLTTAGFSDIPIPEFYPALCVVHEEDYERAVLLIREHLERNTSQDEDIVCSRCGEENPGNFEVCWSCGAGIGPSEG